MTAARSAISQFGLTVLLMIVEFGRFTLFAASTASWLPRLDRWLRWRLLGPQFFAVGVASIPVVAVTGGFIGMILALEGFEQFRAIGQEGRLGGVINVSVTKQIGPVLAAVMVAGRVGGALAAELGTMRVTEQLDALRAMGADPIPYLVVPRFVACVIMTPLLTIYSDVLGVWGGWLITVQFYDVSPYEYWDFTRSFVTWWEPMTGLIKSVFFGGSIGLIACYKGFNCEAGAAGVGRAATEAFVASFLTIIALNLVLAKLLNTINSMFIYEGTRSAFG
ncbi:MAG: ABC transporter permease [Phycisphaerales bacterium]|nr:ABC transporter permease [Phycisphaerales bacterium]MCI0630919.1 ABC transporter permease [Phycisphaerales bacterium]